MHSSARKFVADNIPNATSVVEVGSLDINGNVRSLLPGADWYGIDLAEGRGVDEVASGVTFTPDWPVDLAICCEVFEHTPEWRDIVRNMASWLDYGDCMIITAAGPGRVQHSAIDGGPLRAGEWYENIDPGELAATLSGAHMDGRVRVSGDDVYAISYKLM